MCDLATNRQTKMVITESPLLVSQPTRYMPDRRPKTDKWICCNKEVKEPIVR